MQLIRHLIRAVLLMGALLSVGVVGYTVIEGWGVFQALYMTVITITTVGYGEVYGLSEKGRVFTIFLIIAGFGIMAYIVTTLTQAIIAGQIRAALGRKKLEKMIKKLKDHYILCGFGRIGSVVAKELAKEEVPFVIVERDPEVIKALEEEGYLFLEGDATDDRVLLEAGIKRAKGLVATVSSDADNLYITLSARSLNPKLFILSRADDPEAERKLLTAGATKVVSPYIMGASRMANVLLRPNVVDFIELVVQRKHLELQMEEIEVEDDSLFQGKTLKDSGLRDEFGVIVVAIKRAGKEMIFNPSPEAGIERGDILILLGERKNLDRLEKRLKG
ncbi:MAG: potassium channel protein [Deltaproteobacteria bacterium]|nr:MAG: potassium channel protein [Deltaproteobacteria bacterium]